MRSRILAFGWPAGRLLAESAVARELGVSRVPVREALFILEREGLVEFSESGRAYVRRLRADDFDELFELRLALEPVAARMAAGRRGAALDRLDQLIAETRGADTLADVTRLDLDFHEMIFEISGSRRLARLWCSVRYELEFWLAALHRDHDRQTRGTRAQTADSHAEILTCLRTGTAVQAERLMRDHILGWREWLPLKENHHSTPLPVTRNFVSA